MIHRAGSAILCALAAAALYGTVPNFTRAAFQNGVPAVETTFFRTSLIAVAFAIVGVLQRRSFAVPKAAWPSLLAQAAATLVISVGYLASVQFIPVGLAVIIFFTFPILILVGAPIAEGHAPGWDRIATAVAAFAGLAIAIGAGFDRLDWRGLLLAGAASAGAAVQFFSGRTISRHFTPEVFGSLVHALIWPATLVVALWAGGGTLAIASAPAGFGFTAAVAALYVVAYFVQMLSLRWAPASTVAPFYNMEPVVTVAIAAILLGERLSPIQYAGAALVLAALVVSGWLGMRKAAAP